MFDWRFNKVVSRTSGYLIKGNHMYENKKKFEIEIIDVCHNLAVEAARMAGNMLMKAINSPEMKGYAYGDPMVLKTKEDDKSELMIVELIKRQFPDHTILAEELHHDPTDAEYKWIIDPIDGTNNYLEGRDTFSISIGLEYNSEIVLGVVYLPKRDEIFVAQKGKGATMNGESVRVGTQRNLPEALITFSVWPGLEGQFKWLEQRIKQEVPRAKIFGFEADAPPDPMFGRGSMAAEFCYLACGRIDGLIRLRQKPWDVAAGSLIASEAGAEIKNLHNTPPSIYEGDYIAGNPALMKALSLVIVPERLT